MEQLSNGSITDNIFPSAPAPLKQPFVIGVAGGTASGKTTVCDMIMSQLHDQRVVLVNQDSFYHSLSEEKLKKVHEYNFDHPDAFNTEVLLSCMEKLRSGQPVSIPSYDFKTHQSIESASPVNPADVIILEGILVLNDPQVRDLMNMKIFVDTEENMRRPSQMMKLLVASFFGVIVGFLMGITFPTLTLTKMNLPSTLFPSIDLAYIEDKYSDLSRKTLFSSWSSTKSSKPKNDIPDPPYTYNDTKIWVPSNPRGAERLPPDIVTPESDLYLRRLWGDPNEDLKTKQRYLVTFTVGYGQRRNIDAALKKFSDNFTIMLFHYDGRASEWEEFEWSKRAIHVSIRKQTKWWYAKRFLHPDIVAPYDYIFIWDEDLGVEHFDSEKYLAVVKKHGLEISQPGLEPYEGLTWEMTKKRDDTENDLVHGWGLDFAVRKCVQNAHEKIGVVDAQWIIHQGVPSLGNQGQQEEGKQPWEGVRERCRREWTMFQDRLDEAEKAYFEASAHNNSSSSRPHR
ncbi:hypothetical protein F2Q70_00000204 [Brassica cretica]|uniref:uridine/cytidine kinase n=1 Tax=Brassica cretica TaxID=69181 RepID=A0A8S9ISM3_BRACR|nr:hypothetical protein F2Q70_00000204 [Brassica cretica]